MGMAAYINSLLDPIRALAEDEAFQAILKEAYGGKCYIEHSEICIYM